MLSCDRHLVTKLLFLLGLAHLRLVSSWASLKFGTTSNHFNLRVTTSALYAGSTPETDCTPVVLLSGFLGTGKTTCLKHLLENKEGRKIGVVVNDVAAINIDSKLVLKQLHLSADSDDSAAVVELQNGCACCSLSDELLTSVQQLLDAKPDLHAVVVELSGVADPVATKSNWQTARLQKHPVTERAEISRVVTVIDTCTFGTDWMTWDIAAEREDWVNQYDEHSAVRKVTELLAEQVEAADLILVNKVDMAGEEQVKIASSLVRGMNEKAELIESTFGAVSPAKILGERIARGSEHEHNHEHNHEHSPKECDDTSHSHDHGQVSSELSTHAHSDSHAHSHTHAKDSEDPMCTDSHERSHEDTHEHSHEHSSKQSHEHSHEHSECDDPECNDPSHDHSHSHSHAAPEELGISNFIFKSARPFHGQRLMALLHQWPVPIKEELDIGLFQKSPEEGNEEDSNLMASPFTGVLRSKGFCWIAPTHWSGPIEDVWRHDTAMYWSHAGKHFSVSTGGRWWGTVSKEEMKEFFVGRLQEYDNIVENDFVSEEFGDRRQELVFIGVNLKEAEIRKALESCLCTDEEMVIYKQNLQNHVDAVEQTAGLFGVGATDQIEVA